jgi:hypothetical protein
VINLQAGLGAPPVVFPGVPLKHPSVPQINTGAPMMPRGQVAQRALGCINCLPQGANGLALQGVGDLTTWWARIPTWAKISGMLGLAVGAGLLTYYIASRR